MRWIGLRPCTGMSSAASIPMPCPTGAPVIVGGRFGTFASSSTASGWMPPSWRISAPIVRCACTTPFGSHVVPDVYATSAGALGSTVHDRRRAVRRRRDRRTRMSPAADRRRRRPRPTRGRADRRASSSRLARKSCAPKRSAVTSAFTRVAQDVADLLRAVEVHDRHDDRAEVRDRVERRGRLEPVRKLERDRVAGLHAARPQPGRDRRASASTSPSVPRYGVRSERTVNGSAAASRSPSASRLPSVWSSQNPSRT